MKPSAPGDGTYPGVVVIEFGDFPDVPGLEVVSEGVSSTTLGSIAIGRQGRFLLWGFTADPEGMTETGRRMFLNAVRFLHERRGEAAAPFRCHGRKILGFRLDYVLECDREKNRWAADSKERFEGMIAPPEKEEMKKLPLGRYKEWLERHLPYVRWAGQGHEAFEVDGDALALGTPNDRVESLETWVRLAAKGTGSDRERALRCLDRYVDPALRPPDGDWAAWLASHRGRLRFSDTAGFLFLVWPPR